MSDAEWVWQEKVAWVCANVDVCELSIDEHFRSPVGWQHGVDDERATEIEITYRVAIPAPAIREPWVSPVDPSVRSSR